MTRRRQLIYVTSISPFGSAGQNSFECQVIKAISSVVRKKSDVVLEIYCPSQENSRKQFDGYIDINFIRLKSKSYLQYIIFQWHLFFLLGKSLWQNRDGETYVFVRYHDSMVAPLVLSYLFKFRLTIRTGPVLPNLLMFNRYNIVIYNGIKIVLGEFYRKSSLIVTVTEKIKEWVVTNYAVPADKVVVVANAVDMELFSNASADRGRWGLPENQVVAGFVGHIYKDTGIETIVKAMAILQKKRRASPNLIVAGGGPDLLRLQEMAEYLNVADRIVWTGELPHKDIPSVIASCDIMLVPFTRRIFEIKGSSALKMFEYLACDKPILASDGYDHKFIEEFGLGSLVEPENEIEWSEALTRVSKKKVKLHGRGINYVHRGHTYEALGEKIVELSLLGRIRSRKDSSQ